LNLAVRIKKVRSRNAMSHMAVMSSEMLFLGILTFPMVVFRLQVIDQYYLDFDPKV
jgi:hypothetical protein